MEKNLYHFLALVYNKINKTYYSKEFTPKQGYKYIIFLSILDTVGNKVELIDILNYGNKNKNLKN